MMNNLILFTWTMAMLFGVSLAVYLNRLSILGWYLKNKAEIYFYGILICVVVSVLTLTKCK